MSSKYKNTLFSAKNTLQKLPRPCEKPRLYRPEVQQAREILGQKYPPLKSISNRMLKGHADGSLIAQAQITHGEGSEQAGELAGGRVAHVGAGYGGWRLATPEATRGRVDADLGKRSGRKN
ncbi:hypothetical protein TIFTF001_050913 [Ficus carica]|uniref:Uncharacterized protein n=1 Tax=Ficus carica TaxID=3494 RepID=A0AA87YP02_FICCA|nr:hypothetical protein TIFTF001_050913 [Ficus carica]